MVSTAYFARKIFATDLVILKLVLGFSYEDTFGNYENSVLKLCK